MPNKDITKLVDALKKGDEKELKEQLKRVANDSDISPKQIAQQVGNRLSLEGMHALPWYKGQLLRAGFVLFVVTVLCNAMLSAFFINGATNTVKNELADEMRSYVSLHVPKVPSKIKINVSKPLLHPNGTDSTDIQVTVIDQFDQPLNDTMVEFQSIPPGMGTLQPPTATTQGGIARSVFTAGQTPGEVRITARSGQMNSQEIAIQLREPKKALLQIGLSTEPSQQIKPGGQITFTFSIANKGDALASGVEIFSRIPDGTSFVEASHQGTYQPDHQYVTWKIGTLTPSQETRRTLVVVVGTEQPPGANVTLADYGVRDRNGQEIKGVAPVSLEVPSVANIPTKVVVSANPPTLPADGRSSAIVTAAIFDQFGNPFTKAGYLNFIVSPSDTGSRIDPTSVQLTGNEITTTFMSGQRPGKVTVTAVLTHAQRVISSSVDIELGRTESKTGTINNTAHLFSEPGDDTRNIIIYQIPKGTPVELIDDGQIGNSRKVAVAVWVPKNIIKLNDSRQRGTFSVIVDQQIAVGETPDDPINKVYGSRTLYKAKSNGMTVQILDGNGNNGFVRVRIEGWVLSQSIKVSG